MRDVVTNRSLWLNYIIIISTMIIMKVNCQNDEQSINYQQQIDSHSGAMRVIRHYIQNGTGKHEMYNKLALLCDKFGPRLAGSKALEDSIDYIAAEMRSQGFEVKTENVTVPRWRRGEESAEALLPGNRTIPLSILGVGLSVGTGTPLTGESIVVKSFQELEAKRDLITGKIVVFNQPWVNYSASGAYRKEGATRAALFGARAALIRSVTPLSVYSPHTGMLTYGSGDRIPAACITVEDAEMLQRYQDRGESVRITLTMTSRFENSTVSRNLIIDMKGFQFPNQYVIVGGHIDSWDVGTGALDDGAGVMLALQVLSTIKQLNLRARRTIRVVLWTAEEVGFIGGKEYYDRHAQHDKDNVSLIMESDKGVLKPRGLKFTGSSKAEEIIQYVLSTYLTDLKLHEMSQGGASSDTKWWVESGVPGAELYSYRESYYIYHHSRGDTMSALNSEDLDLASILWTSVIYNVANLQHLLPRDVISCGTVTSPVITSSYAIPLSLILSLTVYVSQPKSVAI